MKRLTKQFDSNRDRSRDSRIDPPVDELSPTHWIDQAVGRRYVDVTIDGFSTVALARKDESELAQDFLKRRESEETSKKKAVALAQDYVTNFREHYRNGRGMVWVGPKGTGKDHLMIAVIRAIAIAASSQAITYRSGDDFFQTFKDSIKSTKSYTQVVERFAKPPLLALSDPLPVKGDLSPHDQEVIYRVMSARYKNMRPTLATINASDRAELEKRMGPQATDRLLGDSIIIQCNWPSYRQFGSDESAK